MGTINIEPFNPFFLYLRKHCCPKCAGRMKPKWSCLLTSAHDYSVDLDVLQKLGVDRSGPDEAVAIYSLGLKCKQCGFSMTAAQMKEWLASQKNTHVNRKSCDSTDAKHDTTGRDEIPGEKKSRAAYVNILDCATFCVTIIAYVVQQCAYIRGIDNWTPYANVLNAALRVEPQWLGTLLGKTVGVTVKMIIPFLIAVFTARLFKRIIVVLLQRKQRD